MISDWITSFSMWQTLIAASTATTVPSLPLPREGAAAVLLPPRRLGVLASIAMLCAVGVSGGRIGTTQRALQGFICEADAPHVLRAPRTAWWIAVESLYDARIGCYR